MSKTTTASDPHETALLARHANLESQIASEQARPHPDAEIIAQLKRQKLRIKDSLHISA